MSADDTFTDGDKVRILVHRSGIVPVSPGDFGTVRSVGLRSSTEPYVAVTITLPAGTVHTSFGPDEIERA